MVSRLSRHEVENMVKHWSQSDNDFVNSASLLDTGAGEDSGD